MDKDNKSLYIITDVDYECTDIIGYFTDKELAYKYLAVNPNYGILEVSCLDCTNEQLANIIPFYEHCIIFIKDGNDWKPRYESCTPYIAEYSRSNSLSSLNLTGWIRVYLNNMSLDRGIAINAAVKLLSEYLNNYKNNVHNLAAYNKFLNAEEQARKDIEAQKRLQEKELAELARLKNKYEQNKN